MRVAANRERAQRHVEMIYHRYDLSPLGFLPERPMEKLPRGQRMTEQRGK